MNAKDELVLTRELVNACRSDKGGFRYEVMHGLTGLYPEEGLTSGWVDRLIGTRIDRAKYDHLLTIRNKKKKGAKESEMGASLFGDSLTANGPKSDSGPKQQPAAVKDDPAPWEPNYDAKFPIDGMPVATSPAQPADTGLVILTLDGKEVARLKPGRYELRKV